MVQTPAWWCGLLLWIPLTFFDHLFEPLDERSDVPYRFVASREHIRQLQFAQCPTSCWYSIRQLSVSGMHLILWSTSPAPSYPFRLLISFRFERRIPLVFYAFIRKVYSMLGPSCFTGNQNEVSVCFFCLSPCISITCIMSTVNSYGMLWANCFIYIVSRTSLKLKPSARLSTMNFMSEVIHDW